MRLRTLVLTSVGGTLVALSWNACGAMYSAERVSGRGLAVFAVALITGAAPFSLGLFRLFNAASRDRSPSVEQAMGIAVVGMLLGLGSAGLMFVPGVSQRLGEVMGAAFFVGLALTVGGLMLCAWASAVRDDLRR